MENYQGDLTDIFRASRGGGGGGGDRLALPQSDDVISNWEFPSDDPQLELDSNFFGDPFVNTRDPLLHGYYGPSSADMISTSTAAVVDEPAASTSTISAASSSINDCRKVIEDEMNRSSPCDVFSRIQITHSNNPVESPRQPGGFKASSLVSIDVMNANNPKSCLIDNSAPLQISSPRNLGIKRRKSQAKKVVCIPAPAVANSRPSGEVVPSDLWAWRKYGQKPIKGSPYPRGYYRCSSSKGCSARKQVERSRTDPNMLVITYTSEHNHPWPTQRNALAGSTRSQPPKSTTTTTTTTNAAASKTKLEEQKESNSNDTLSPDPTLAPVKQEVNVDFETRMEPEMDNNAQIQFDHHNVNSYRPAFPDSSHTQSDDFFADLDEIEADPLDLLFPRDGFSLDGVGHEHKQPTKSLDPFTLFDWSGDHQNNNNVSTGEGNKGL